MAQSSLRIERTMYRALLRFGRRFDKNPEAKFLLFRKAAHSKENSNATHGNAGTATATGRRDDSEGALGYYTNVVLRQIFTSDSIKLYVPTWDPPSKKSKHGVCFPAMYGRRFC